MAVATRNSELIPESELNVLIKYNQELLNTKANLGAIIPVLHNAALGVETYTGEYKTLVQMLQTFEKTQQDTSKRVREHSNALSAVEKATKQFAYAQSAEAKEVALVKEQLRQKNAELRTNAREALAAEGSLNQLRAQLVQLKAEAANLDLNSKEFTEASVRINELNGTIMKAEAAMGDHRRNVGNYASAFNNLGFQVQQVARELPSLTISPQQFFLAISNNLPMLADAYAETIAKNKQLREENLKLAADQQKQVIPAWKQMLKSIVSWQTAIVVGITLLTTYGKEIGEFISKLFRGEKAINAIALSTEQYRNAVDNANKSVADEVSTLKLLYNAATDNQKPMNERISAVKELQRLYPNYLGNMSQEEIMAGQASIQYQNLATHILEVAKAKAVQDKISENQAKILELEIEEAEQLAQIEATQANIERQRATINSGGTSDIIVAYQKQLSLTEKRLKRERESLKVIQQSKQALEDTSAQLANKISVSDLIGDQSEPLDSSSVSSSLSERRQAEIDLLKTQAQEEAGIQERIYQDEQLHYDKRLEAFEKFREAQEKLLSLQYGADREELDVRLAAGKIDRATYEAVAQNLDLSEMIAFDDLRREQEEAGKELMESIGKGMIEQARQSAEHTARKLDEDMQAELLALSAKYASGNIGRDEYNAGTTAISDAYKRKEFEAEIRLMEELWAQEELTEEHRTEVAKKLADARLAYDEYIQSERIRLNLELAKQSEDQAKKEEEIAKRDAELKKQLLQEVFNLASALSDAQLDKELSRLDKLSEANQKWQDEETDRIDRLADHGVISDEQADARKKAIEEQAALREEEIEKQRVEAERRNAIFQKAQAVAQAGINTALAVTAALTNPFTSAATIPLIIAAGAAQIATILATPIPEYAQGTKDHAGGLAVVGDGGRSEMVVFPDNRVWKTPATDTVVNLPAHTQVLPDYDAVLAQFAFSRFANMPSDMSRVEMLLEEEKLQRGMMLEKSTERNRLLRQIISNGNADRRYSQRYGVTYVLNYHKKLS
jgi:hypothetical protein